MYINQNKRRKETERTKNFTHTIKNVIKHKKMTRTKTRKPKLNCCTFDDYNDHNDFLYTTFTDPEDLPTMNETHTETDEEDTAVFSSNSKHVSTNTGECSADENELVIQTIEQATSIDEVNNNISIDDAFETTTKTTAVPMTHINVTPKPRHANEEEVNDDVVSLYTADIDNITLNDAETADDLELDFSDVLIIEDSCHIHSDSDSSAVLINEEEETKTDMSANDENNSSSIADSWDVLSTMQHLKDQDSSYEWDAISSPPSVMSMGTFQTLGTTKTLTYKDILSKRGTSLDEKSKSLSSNHKINTNKKAPSMTRGVITLSSSSSGGDQERASSLMLPIIEDDECSFSPFDAYHELEGYKCSRGGKKSLQFRRKKNQKEKKKMTFSFSVK